LETFALAPLAVALGCFSRHARARCATNGSFGNENPGSETLRLVFVRPIDRRRRQRR